MIKSYLAFVRSYTLQAARDWTVVLLSLVIPTAFYALFTYAGLPVAWALTMSLVFAIVVNGLFGTALRVVHERQLGVLRRLRAAPVSPSHVVIGAVFSGVIVFAPCFFSLVMMVTIGSSERHLAHPDAALALIIVGVLCSRSIGVFVAAVTESVQQTQLVAQVMIMFLIFTSGMAWSPDVGTSWMRLARDVSPSYHLTVALFGVLGAGEGITDVLRAVAVLLLISVLSIVAATYCFRWDTDNAPNLRMRLSIGTALCLLLFGLSRLL